MAVLKHLTYLRISSIPTAFVQGTNDQSGEFCVATCLLIKVAPEQENFMLRCVLHKVFLFRNTPNI